MRRLLVAGRALWLAALVGALVALGAAWLAGWRLNVVDTSSMSPEVPAGSLAVVAPVRPAAVEVGDVVTFPDPGDHDRVVLHRVVEVTTGADGGLMLRTQGDANATPDAVLVPARAIEGKLRMAVPHLGSLVVTLSGLVGYLLLIGLPVLLLVVSELRRLRSRSAAAACSAARHLQPGRGLRRATDTL